MEYVVKTNLREELYYVKSSILDVLLWRCREQRRINIKRIHQGGAGDWWMYWRDNVENVKSWCVTNYKDTKILYIEF